MHEVIQEAKKVMRHSKRDYLTCEDVKLAMSKLNVSDVFGYPSYAPPYQYQQMNFNPSHANLTSNQPGQEQHDKKESEAKKQDIADTPMTGADSQAEQAILWYQKP